MANNYPHLLVCLSCQFTFIAYPGPKECARCGSLYVKDYGEATRVVSRDIKDAGGDDVPHPK